MLVSLHVKNLALIDETEVVFGKGLNILTGETGAGKSIILGSVHLALGGKADKSLIRNGADYALVELLFQVEKEEQFEKLKELDVSMDNDLLIIQRKITATRSVCKVNGELVSSKQLKELASIFINIHGQHENQTLLNAKKYSEILDDYASNDLYKIKAQLKKYYKEYVLLSKELEKISIDEGTRLREISLATFEINEIENANLVLGEDEELEQKYRKMMNGKKIKEVLSHIYLSTSYEEESGAGNQIGRGLREMQTVLSFDTELAQLEEQLVDIDNLLNDFNRGISDYLTDLQFDEEDYVFVETRLNTINHLKDKYGNTIEKIVEYKLLQQDKLEKLSDYEVYQTECRKKLEEVREYLLAESAKASKVRSRYGKQLSGLLKTALIDLNFNDVDFEIQVIPKEEMISPEGYDEIHFMISTNPGEPKKSMSSVASGGELSRIMLALKTVMADQDKIDTLIFDEIDAGISGITAWKVSEKMAVIGKDHQVICITHLPQIASMADSHFVIEKSSDKQSTRTDIREVKEQALLNELARLLGGSIVTDTVLANANEMKELAIKTKKNIK